MGSPSDVCPAFGYTWRNPAVPPEFEFIYTTTASFEACILFAPKLENTGVGGPRLWPRTSEKKTDEKGCLLAYMALPSTHPFWPLFQVMKLHSFPTHRRISEGTTLPRMHYPQREEHEPMRI